MDAKQMRLRRQTGIVPVQWNDPATVNNGKLKSRQFGPPVDSRGVTAVQRHSVYLSDDRNASQADTKPETPEWV
jgi:hypothetical protein